MYQIIKVTSLKIFPNKLKFNIIPKEVTAFCSLYLKKMRIKHDPLLILIIFNTIQLGTVNIKFTILINLVNFNSTLIDQWLSTIQFFNINRFTITSFKILTIEILTKAFMKNKLFKSNKILIHQKIKVMDFQSMNNLLSKLADSSIFKSKT